MAGISSDFMGSVKLGIWQVHSEIMLIVKKRGTLVGSGLRQVCVFCSIRYMFDAINNASMVSIETFVVPDQQTCDAYDSAINKIQVPVSVRKRVLQHVTGIIVNNATHLAHIDLMQKRSERDIMLSKLNASARAHVLKTLAPLDMALRQLIVKASNKWKIGA